MATGDGPPGWRTTVIVRLNERVARLLDSDHPTSLADLLARLPKAGVTAAARFRHHVGDGTQRLNAPLRRAMRDTIAAELLAGHREREWAGALVPTSSTRPSSSSSSSAAPA